jgi:pimeloyl-ACP methyl ester carboxylesterase
MATSTAASAPARTGRARDCECHGFDARIFEGEGSVRLRALHAGRRNARDAVVLLHGFPDCAFTWRRQMRPLARAGCYAIALDLRGAGASSTPREPEAYRLERFVDDVKMVVHALRDGHAGRRVHLVAHDFGAHVAWLTAMDADPERLPISSLTVISGVHPAHARTLGAVPSRMTALAHVGVMHIPGLAETVLSPEILVDVLATNIRRDRFGGCDADHYLATFRRPHVRAAMFQWYRQLTSAVLREPRIRCKPVHGVRVLTIHGAADRILDRQLVAPPPSWVTPLDAALLRNCRIAGGHWPHWDDPEGCARELLRHIGA